VLLYAGTNHENIIESVWFYIFFFEMPLTSVYSVMRLLHQQMSLLASAAAADDLLTPPSAAAAITQIWYTLYNVIKSMNYLLWNGALNRVPWTVGIYKPYENEG
jgi:hypothetical protein